MKKRKLNKKSIIIVSIILIILLIEFLNPIKLYYKHELGKLNYSEESIQIILKNNLKDEILEEEYNKALDIILKSSDFNLKYFSIYMELQYYELENFTKNVNTLIEKGYNASEISVIFKSATNDSLKNFIENDYFEDVSKFLKYDFSLLANYERYVKYQESNNINNELVVVYVNIGLDKDFYEDTKIIEEFKTDMLVNRYIGLESTFIPSGLMEVSEDYAIDSKQELNEEVLKSFIKMSDDCKASVGYKLLVRSGYRDYKNQEDTYNLYLKTYGKQYAENYVAHPGFSEHQTGLAIDIKAESNNTFAGTKESEWLKENAYKYGFILRYKKDTENITGVKYESWHYRYVGTEIASYINENDMTYDEYYIRFLNK